VQQKSYDVPAPSFNDIKESWGERSEEFSCHSRLLTQLSLAGKSKEKQNTDPSTYNPN